MLLLQSCSEKTSAPASTAVQKNKIVLSAFNDMVTASSYKPQNLSLYPTEVNFSDKMTDVKNQGERGTCTFFAATALIEAAIKIDLGLDTNISEEYMIYTTKNQGYYDDVEASHVSVNLQASKADGILLERDWSYMPFWFGPGRPCEGLEAESDETPIDCFTHVPMNDEIQKRVIPGKAIKTGFIRKDTNEIIKFLASNKRPLTISLPVNYRGWKNSGDVTYTEEMRQECLNTPKACGAHSVLLTGYNLEKEVFYFKNSWSNDWGNNGFGEISFSMVDRYVDGYLYYAKIDGKLDIPEDYSKSYLEVKDFQVHPKITDNGVDVEIDLDMPYAHGRFMEAHVYMAIKYTDEYGLPAVELLHLTEAESMLIMNDSPIVIAPSYGDTKIHARFSPLIMGLPTVMEAMNNPEVTVGFYVGLLTHTDLPALQIPLAEFDSFIPLK